MRTAILIATLWILPLTTSAQTTLKATFGWGNSVRRGCWTPIFVTLADQQTRSIILHIHGLYGVDTALEIHQRVVAEPQPKNFCVLYPVNSDPSKIAVTATDEQTGQTLAGDIPQNPSDFSPAGHVPIVNLAPEDTLVGISGDITEALKIHEQLSDANLHNGVLTTLELPANAVGYEGINALILAAPNLHDLDDAQQKSIVAWIAAGGNLLFIPDTDDLPADSQLANDLPCDVGGNQLISLPTTDPSTLNARSLTPHADAQAIQVREWTAYTARRGLGRITVLPADISPLHFLQAPDAVTFWRSAFAEMISVPDIPVITAMDITNQQEDIMRSGPTIRDSIGRGSRETFAIRNLLDTQGAAHPIPSNDWHGTLLMLAGVCLLLGPLDSILLMRLGQPPRHWLTVAGWLGLLSSLAAYGASSLGSANIQIHAFRLIDQIDNNTIAATDVISLESSRATSMSLSLDSDEFWEPANQASQNFSPDDFVDDSEHEDQHGCRPETMELTPGLPKSFRGQSLIPGPANLSANLSLRADGHLIGKITNNSPTPLTDVQIATSSGNCRLSQSIPPSAEIEIDQSLSSDAIAPASLPADILNITPYRTDRITALIASGDFASIVCQCPQAPAIRVADVAQVQSNNELVRAVVPISK